MPRPSRLRATRVCSGCGPRFTHTSANVFQSAFSGGFTWGRHFYGAANVAIFTFRLLLAKDLGMSLNDAGKLLGWVSGAGVILYWPLGWLSRSHSSAAPYHYLRRADVHHYGLERGFGAQHAHLLDHDAALGGCPGWDTPPAACRCFFHSCPTNGSGSSALPAPCSAPSP